MNAEYIPALTHSPFNLDWFAGCILSNPKGVAGKWLPQSQLSTPL